MKDILSIDFQACWTWQLTEKMSFIAVFAWVFNVIWTYFSSDFVQVIAGWVWYWTVFTHMYHTANALKRSKSELVCITEPVNWFFFYLKIDKIPGKKFIFYEVVSFQGRQFQKNYLLPSNHFLAQSQREKKALKKILSVIL